MSRLTTVVAAACCALLLDACGGGGSGSGANGGNPGGGSNGGGNVVTVSLNVPRVDMYYESPLGFGNTGEVTVTFSGAGVVVTTLPGETLPPWLFVGTPTAINNSSARVNLTFNPTSYEPRRYSTTLRFATADANGGNIAFTDLIVTGTIDHTLSIQSQVLTYTRGATLTPHFGIELRTENATWQATSDSPWLQVSPTGATGNATLNVMTNPTGLAEGNYSGRITVRDTVTNRTKSALVLFGVDPRRLETSKRGLAFSSTLGGAALSRSLRVIDTANLAGRWTVSSSASWLSVSSYLGNGSTDITVHADPTGLAEGMHYATLTIAPDNDPGLANSATVRAGFYVDRTAAATNPTIFESEVGYLGAIAMDPIRPYFYSVGYEAPNAHLNVWNTYTGQRVAQLPIGALFPSSVAISADGSLLLVVNGGTGGGITPIRFDGETRTVGTAWSGLNLSAGIENLAITRISGSDVVVWGPGQLLSATNGAALTGFGLGPHLNASIPRFVGAAPDGSAAFIAGQTNGNHSLIRIALGFRAGLHTATITHDLSEPGSGQRPVVDPTGRYLYSGSDWMRRYDASSLELQRAGNGVSPGEVDVLDDGTLFVAVNRGSYVHADADLVEIAARRYGTSFFYTGRVSGDGRRVFTLSDSGSEFRDRDW